MNKVLIIDDDPNFVQALSKLVEREGFEVDIAKSAVHAKRQLARNRHDLIFVDLALPDGNGVEVIRRAPADHKGRFIIMTGYPSVPTAVEALRGRALDYIVKPLQPEKLKELLAAHHDDAAPADAPQAPAAESVDETPLIGDSTPMQDLLDEIHRVAPMETSVVILGETGTGKDLVARHIHRLSARPGPFVVLKEELTVDEINHKRSFERARGGTLFLDEIAEMPLDLQAGLLRILDNDADGAGLDIRVVAATNQDPDAAMDAGRLRPDFYFRVSKMLIRVPPLRQRSTDIPRLARHFLDQLNREHDTAKTLNEEDALALARQPWPGNVRELENTIGRAFLKSDVKLELSDEISDKTGAGNGGETTLVGLTIAEVEERLIRDTLAHMNGDKPKAAEYLGISLKTLYNRLNQYDRP